MLLGLLHYCLHRIWRPALLVTFIALLVQLFSFGNKPEASTSELRAKTANMSAANALKFLTVPARTKHTATVIFVHVRHVGSGQHL